VSWRFYEWRGNQILQEISKKIGDNRGGDWMP
jgi:hypothetical protein